MKLMIASDIHGSAYYCEKMERAFRKEKADKLLLLGDILYHGCRNDLPEGYDPRKVIDILNGMKNELLCVRGNCDSEVDQMVLEFPIMAEYCILYLDSRIIFATHGHKFNENNLPMIKQGDILLNGHTHVPKYVEHESYLYVNCGSVTIPKEGSPHSYLILEERKLLWKNMDDECFKRYVIDD